MNPPKKIFIVGRPNVGKSSLYNALLGYRRTIVLDLPGTTLDTVSEMVKWEKRNFLLSDTQGIFDEKDGDLLRKIIGQADAVLFMVDAKAGLLPFDRWIAQIVAGLRKPTLLLVNKVDVGSHTDPLEYSVLGFDEWIPVATSHRRGLDEVKAWCLSQLDAMGAQSEEEEVDPTVPVSIALIGRPNAGKSTLMNRLAQDDISKVSPIPHTTRDSVSHIINTPEGPIRLVDTAGIRRPRSKKNDLEIFSIQAATRMIREADVVFLLIACHEQITDQDMRLLSLVEREGRPTTLLLNFWDMLDNKQRRDFIEDSDFRKYLANFKTLPISGLTGFGTDRILPIARSLYKKSNRRVKTSRLNEVVDAIIQKNPPPANGKQHFNFLYASQVKVDPPTFVFFMNRKGELPDSYTRYLTNSLRDRLGLKGQTIRLNFRGGEKRPNARPSAVRAGAQRKQNKRNARPTGGQRSGR